MTNEKREEVVVNASKIAAKLISHYTNKEYSFSLESDDISKTFIYYENLKIDVKRKISITDFNQDRHKIAATSIISLLSYCPIKVNNHPTTVTNKEVTIWINQSLALAVAEYIIFSFLEIPYQTFVFPKTTTTEEKDYYDYLMALILSIESDITRGTSGYENKVANYITSLSHILYLIERYTLDKSI